MTIASGTRVGPFLVADRLGSGGMGEVFRARDTRLERDVAIKVLPPAVASDPERLARLQREARTLAALNHPNIAQIFGLEEGGGVSALVMELVDGPTLAERIARGPIPLDEAIPIARQIADALESAHEQGIVHRDLKPANIKLRPDGTVKVLDFGLARAVAPTGVPVDSNELGTITSPAMMTQVGVILGTAAYMSPEQAKGRQVDRRTDIWAFGVVLAEMLSARRLFGGDTVSETLASVLKDEPAIPDAPPAIRQLLGRCLERDPRRRLRDIGEARLVLEDPESARSQRGRSAAAAGRARPGLTWTAAAVTVAAVAAAGGWLLKPGPRTSRDAAA
jgi:eukaryotic-like serine/threonine-protein kinase